MNIQLNGESKQVEGVSTITDLLKVAQVKMPEMVSVEVNGEIIDREDFDTFSLKEDDAVEFLYFMGGGSVGF
jgi:sulfur carrier protein